MSYIKPELKGRAPGDHAQDPSSHSASRTLTQRPRVLMKPGMPRAQQSIYAMSDPVYKTVNKRWSLDFSDTTDVDYMSSNYCWAPSEMSDSESIAGRIATGSPGVEWQNMQFLASNLALQKASPSNTVSPSKPTAGYTHSQPRARQDSAVGSGPYISAPTLPHGKAEPRDEHTGAARLHMDQRPAPNSVKRCATEMSHDVMGRPFSPRKSPRWHVLEGPRRTCSLDPGHFAKSGLGRDNSIGNTDCRRLPTSNTWPQIARRDTLRRIPAIDEADTARPIASIACQTNSRAHTDFQHVKRDSVSFVVNVEASPPDCQAWVLNQPEQCKDQVHDVPFDPPSTLYQPESELDCHESGENATSCVGVLSMRTYLAAKGSGPGCTLATWEDAEDMLEELVRSDVSSSLRGENLYLHQLIDLVPSAAKDAYKEVDAATVDSWLFAYLIDDNDALEIDALLEVLLLICMGLCDLEVTVYQLACFIASWLRSLAAITNDLLLPDAHTHAAPTPCSLGSSGNGSNLQEHAGDGNNNASSSQRSGMGDTGNGGTGSKPSGKRRFSGGPDRGDEHFEGNEPGPEGNAEDGFAGKLNAQIPCVHASCTAIHRYISGVIRCLKKHKVRVCPICWCQFRDEKSLQSHQYLQELNRTQQADTGLYLTPSTCEKHCVSLCDENADPEVLRSSEAIKNQRHRLTGACLKQKCPESRAAQWRYLYALTYPGSEEVPDFVLKQKKPRLKSIEEELALGDPHPSPSINAAMHALRRENDAMRSERGHFIHLLELSSSFLAEDKSELAMTLRRCISEKVSGHAYSAQTGPSHGIDDSAAPAPTMPLTPKSCAPQTRQVSVGAGASAPFSTQNFQNTPSWIPLHQRRLDLSSMSGSQPVQRTQAAAALYQQRVAPPNYGSKDVSAAIYEPQPQALGNWLPLSMDPTSYNTLLPEGSARQPSGYDFNAQQGRQGQFNNLNEHFSFDGIGGSFAGS
ncbi:hypothetical protein CKM354_000475400 [Cercospora kikuchii]|uniref:Uncharacterized protein n=1 Tax=Cercospora kikuchii TaxID=84275 RepID=A0A9P3CGF1_9PEZI|nr:uncharacterized protein CKM354_000475400 [Cercospora kikuchii]GIZ41451.1 hypothetical protein CKM354_000475400 [Cercospora kikuchii]